MSRRTSRLNPVATVRDMRDSTLQAAIEAAGGKAYQVRERTGSYSVTNTVNITDAVTDDLIGSKITQASAVNLATLVHVTLPTGEPGHDMGLFVDGNRDNNTTAVTGVWFETKRRSFGKSKIGARNCDTAVLIKGDVEFSEFDISAEYCGTALEVTTVTGHSPDELMVDLRAHDIDTILKMTDDGEKTSGAFRITGEQTNSWALDIDQGWLDLSVVVRAAGLLSGGGYRQGNSGAGSGNLHVAGEVFIMGGHATNCGWLFDILGGSTDAVRLRGKGDFVAGARIGSGVDAGSSAVVQIISAPASGPALWLGDTSGGSGLVPGFRVLPGSRLYNPTGVAINLAGAQGCVLEPSRVAGQVVIGGTSTGNIIRIPYRSIQNDTISFANTSASSTNVILLMGRYTLSNLASKVPSPCTGMYVEGIVDYGYSPARWNGSAWTPISYYPGGTDVPVADGGTGVSTLTGIVKGNGTSAFSAATDGTDYISGTTLAAYPFTTDKLTSGFVTIPRFGVNSTAITVASGTEALTYFTADKTQTVSQVRVRTGSTAAAATPTVCRLALYSVAANGDLTEIASTTNDTSLFSSTSTNYTVNFAASASITRGNRYAVGLLVVTGAATPTFAGASTSAGTAESAVDPRVTGVISGLSDLASSPVANAGISVGSNMLYARVF